ncbi:MAG: hypothetical protein ACXVNO_02230 [Bacteroidia bacterium]
MKTKEGYPREINKISQILGYAEEHESEEEESEDNQPKTDVDPDEEADSSHYSIGGDNGW